MKAEEGKQEVKNIKKMLKLYKWYAFDEIDFEDKSTWLIDTLGFWPTPLPPTFRNFQKCSFLPEIQIPIYVMKERSAINSKGSDWYCRCQLQHCGP